MGPAGTHQAFEHVVAFYEGDEGFLERALPFVREGLARDEPVRVATSARKGGRLAAELGEDAERVEVFDIEALGRNPACILPIWTEFAERHRGRPVRGIGEPVWPDRSAAELEECEHHESLLNLAFEQGPGLSLLCPYDTGTLEPEVLDRALRAHPSVVTNGAVKANPDYVPPRERPSPFAGELPPAPPAAVERHFGPDDLADLRGFTHQWARRAGLDRASAEDVTLAVHELAANSVRHGGGSGTLRAWTEGRAVVCEVRDDGRITEPLAGRRLPGFSELDGRGLWVVNHLCDLVQIRTSPDGGSLVRLRIDPTR